MIRTLRPLVLGFVLLGAGALDPPPPMIPPHLGSWGVALSDQDRSVKPGDDFFMFQNGAWYATAEILPQAPGAAYWRDLRILTPYRLRDMLGALRQDRRSLSNIDRKALTFYQSYMDERTIERLGIAPLKAELDEVRAAKTKEAMAALTGRVEGPESQRDPVLIQPIGRGIFTLNIRQDQADPNRYAVYVGQGGLHLLGPEYYLDPKLADIKQAYRAYVEKMLALAGWPSPAKYAGEIVDLETRIAKASWSRERMKDVTKTYNPIAVDDLATLAPGFNWRAFLNGAGLTRVDRVVIDAKGAFPDIAAIFAQTPVDVLQARQAFSAADNGASRLNRAMVEANYDFRIKTLGGQSVVNNPRWIRALREMQVAMNDILATLYVRRYFSTEDRERANEMVRNLVRALDNRLAKSQWLSQATIARAREKLAKMKIEVGAPQELDDYRTLTVRDDDLYGNAARATAYKWAVSVRRLDGPFDRKQWILSPQVAGYNYVPTTNTVEIPAASFQPPFFDAQADPAVNYGAIGALIASAMINGFDSTGRQYDGDGRLVDWWTPADAGAFTERTTKLSAQYSAMEPLPGIHVKGDLSSSQAMADIGGLETARDAYHLATAGQEPRVLDGYTGDQRVFLGWAQLWRAKMRAAFVRMLLATGANPPPSLRVDGVVNNIDSWYEAFKVEPGEKMYIDPGDRVHIW